jgi:hypothetical protein
MAEKDANTGLRVVASHRFTSRLVRRYRDLTQKKAAPRGRNTGMMKGTDTMSCTRRRGEVGKRPPRWVRRATCWEGSRAGMTAKQTTNKQQTNTQQQQQQQQQRNHAQLAQVGTEQGRGAEREAEEGHERESL